MADTPVYIHWGDDQLNGGLTGLPNTEGVPIGGGLEAYSAAYVGISLAYPAFSQPVPVNPATGGVPVSPAYLPYWDGYYVTTTFTATSATTTRITKTGAGWTPSNPAWMGRTLTVTAGAAVGETRYIADNGADWIDVTVAFSVAPTTSTIDIKAGAYVVYHHTNSRSANMPALLKVVPGTGGDTWYGLGGGITPTTLLMNKLSIKHAQAPYFRMIKNACPGGIVTGAAPMATTATPTTTGLGWTIQTAETDFALARLTAEGHTPVIKALILDASVTDMINSATAFTIYKTGLQTTITAIRTKYGTTFPIVIVNHHKSLMRTTYPSAAAFVREIHRQIANENDDVVLQDMSWAELGQGSLLSFIPAADPTKYDIPSYVQMGVRLHNTITAWETEDPPAAVGSGVPVAVLIADSQGAVLNTLVLTQGFQSSILGPYTGDPNTTIRSGQWIYNGNTKSIELYDVTANATTWPTLNSGAGSEVTMMKALADRYPNGIVFYKFTLSGMSLTEAAASSSAIEQAANDQWPLLEEGWRDCAMIAIPRDLGRVADAIGVGLILGDNDCFNDGPTAFPTSAPSFIEDLRSLFTTRSNGAELPIVWMQPQKHLNDGGQSEHGTQANRNSVMASVASLTTINRVRVILADPARYELNRVDHIHFGGEAVFNAGYDIAEQMLELIDEVEGETQTTTVTASSSAAFTVETGSGLADANALCSVEYATAFLAEQGNPSEWSSADVYTQRDAIRQMTEWVNSRRLFAGSKTVTTQSCAFPRIGLTDRDGWTVDSAIVPVDVKKAVAYGAYRIVKGDWSPNPDQEDGSVQSDSINLGGLSFSTSLSSPKQSTEIRLPLVEAWLRPFLRASNGRLVRG